MLSPFDPICYALGLGAIFGIGGKKPAPTVEPLTVNSTPADPTLPSAASVYVLTGKALLVSIAGILAQQITSIGIDATPLAVLPPVAKIALSLVAPMVAAWLAKSPLKK